MEKIQQNIERTHDEQGPQPLTPKGLYIWGGVGIGLFKLLHPPFTFCRQNNAHGHVLLNHKDSKEKKSSFP
jgi:predicted ATPase